MHIKCLFIKLMSLAWSGFCVYVWLRDILCCFEIEKHANDPLEKKTGEKNETGRNASQLKC